MCNSIQNVFGRPCVLPPPTKCFQKAMCSSSTNKMLSEGHVFFFHQQNVFRRPCVLPPPTKCFQKAMCSSFTNMFFLHQQHVFYSLLISFFVIFYITLINNLPKSDFVIFYITLINNLPSQTLLSSTLL